VERGWEGGREEGEREKREGGGERDIKLMIFLKCIF
jgi:hypothetical protein